MTDLATDLAELDAQISAVEALKCRAIDAAHDCEAQWCRFEIVRLGNLRRIRVDLGETP